MFTTKIPIPPSTNVIWKVGKKKMYLNPKYSEWKNTSTVMALNNKKGDYISGHYSLILAVGRPDKRRRDIDNIIKPVSDLLVGIQIVEDDSLCNRVTAFWSNLVEKGYVKISIKEWRQ